jgi:hypothetical protein
MTRCSNEESLAERSKIRPSRWRHVRRADGVYLVRVEQLDRVSVFLGAMGPVPGWGWIGLFPDIIMAG